MGEDTQDVDHLDDSVETPAIATGDEPGDSDVGLLDSEDEETPLTGAKSGMGQLGAFADSPEAKALGSSKE